MSVIYQDREKKSTTEKPIHLTSLKYVCLTNTPADLILQGQEGNNITDLDLGLITLSSRMAFNRKPFRLGRAVSPLLSSPKQRDFSV